VAENILKRKNKIFEQSHKMNFLFSIKIKQIVPELSGLS
jgi:hypothetical protein